MIKYNAYIHTHIYSLIHSCFFKSDYTIHKTYVSFRLLNSLRLLFSKNNSEIQEWNQVIRGNREIISEDNERLINDWLENICNKKIQEINQILNDINESEKEKMQVGSGDVVDDDVDVSLCFSDGFLILKFFFYKFF